MIILLIFCIFGALGIPGWLLILGILAYYNKKRDNEHPTYSTQSQQQELQKIQEVEDKMKSYHILNEANDIVNQWLKKRGDRQCIRKISNK